MGGQKCCWDDLIHHDLVKFGLEQDRHELVQDSPAWQRVVKACLDTVNKEAEQKEDKRKDKKRRTQKSNHTAALAGFIHTCILPCLPHRHAHAFVQYCVERSGEYYVK